MKFFKRITLLFCMFALSGCALPPENIAAPDLEASKKVAIVSLLGTSFHAIRVSTTVFGNVSYDVPVADWNIDRMVEQVLVATVSKNGARTPIILPHDPDLGTRLEKSRSAYRYDYDEVLKLARQQKADTLLLVQTQWVEDPPHYKPGYGFFERTFLGKSNRCVYASFSVRALSVQTGKPLARGFRELVCSGTTEIEWKESFDQYTVQEKQQLRRLTEDKIKQGVTKALSTMGF